ncbi:MAG: SDR family NAD(P)-dependent oxidoreductase [Proteobacteria bacterium]|nr:SDR family NAD(P)-dependent oxidoreductase [Pseudomonadota bacterium]HQR02903.1 SDR family NAD(P)-dependent oxidoreductase [Rhodocyclaceae bacterium]
MTAQEKFRHQYGPWALVAGASEGIGRSFAEHLAAQGLNLILLSRRADVLEASAAQIRARHGGEVATHAVDLTAPDFSGNVDAIVGQREIGFLVYNAGAVHGAGLFHDEPLDKALNLVRLNCIGPLVLTHRIGAGMKARGRGGIVLLSSLASLAGGAYVAAYAATKAFDMVLAQSLWAELKGFGVDVLGLVAGATRTPAMASSGLSFRKTEAPSSSGPETNVLPMEPDEVVAEAFAHLAEGPLWFPGEKNRASAAAMRAAPHGQAVEAMSAAAAGMYGRPWPLGPHR